MRGYLARRRRRTPPLTSAGRRHCNRTLESDARGLGGRRRPDGRVLYAAANPDDAHRSDAARSLEAAAGVFVAASGIGAASPFLPAERVLCASHSGEPRHVAAAAAMLRGRQRRRRPGLRQYAPFRYRAAGLPPPRRIRRSPTTAPANTCGHAGLVRGLRCAEARPRFDHPLQRAVRRSVATFAVADPDARSPGASTAARRRRTTRCRCPASRGRSHASAAMPTIPDSAPRRAHTRAAMTAHPEMVSGRARRRPRADAGRPGRLGPRSVPRRAGDRRRQPRLGHRRSRSPTAPPAGAGPRWSPCSTSSGLLDDRRRPRALATCNAPCATSGGTVVGDAPAVLAGQAPPYKQTPQQGHQGTCAAGNGLTSARRRLDPLTDRSACRPAPNNDGNTK